MDINELYLKTLFCCSACDGEIASEEVALVKRLTENEKAFEELDVESILNRYVELINVQGSSFLKNYLKELEEASLTNEQQIKLIDLAIKMIEADNQVLYSEIKFFKKIRSYLSITDESVLERMPNKEDYLLPETKESEFSFDKDIHFEKIDLGLLK